MPRPFMLPSLFERLGLFVCVTAFVFAPQAAPAQTPLGSSISYQGGLIDSGSPANASYDFLFALHDDAAAGSMIAGPLSVNGVAVAEGLFTVSLDFGAGAFDGNQRWFEIQVSPAGAGTFETLSPRQELTPAAYALFAANSAPGDRIRTASGNALAIVSDNGRFAAGDPSNAVRGDFSTVGGGLNNIAGGMVDNTVRSATIAGGENNQIFDIFGTISGGISNTVGVSGEVTGASGFSTVGGGQSNTASGRRATVGGGSVNMATADHATVGGGLANEATSLNATVAGGNTNMATGDSATVAGGLLNNATGFFSAVGGGHNNNAPGPYATVSGGADNTASGDRSTVGGGELNTARGASSTVAGGQGNQAGTAAIVTAGNADYATVGGGLNNIVGGMDDNPVRSSTIAGGEDNQIFDAYGTISGGLGNTAGGASGGVPGVSDFSTVGGGVFNTASGTFATVGGGAVNMATAENSTVGGGNANEATHLKATVGGGYNNTVSGENATIAGGFLNNATGFSAALVGGFGNDALGPYATVSGGLHNTASGERSTVAGGADNTASGLRATVGGGGDSNGDFIGNTASGEGATVSGGVDNTASGFFSTVAGGELNTARGASSTVGGGSGNQASTAAIATAGFADYTTVSGGQNNRVGGALDTRVIYSTIGGGRNNQVFNHYGTISGGSGNAIGVDGSALAHGFSTIGGGEGNIARSEHATVGGGVLNQAVSDRSTVGGGQENIASGPYAAVGGGFQNTASGEGAASPGGRQNAAGGAFSFAAGQEAQANANNSFVWNDGGGPLTDNGANTFTAQATGGVFLPGSVPAATGSGEETVFIDTATGQLRRGAAAGGDNLGDHAATRALDMGGFDIDGAGVATAAMVAAGSDATPGFGYSSPLTLRQPSVSLYFDDSSNVGAFPSRDWRLTANDSTPGGAEYFAIDDVSAATRPFSVGGNAPDNSLVVEPTSGEVGVGTPAPSTTLHVAGGVRVEGALFDANNQPGTSGQVLSSTGSGADWVDPSTLGGIVASSDSRLWAFQSGDYFSNGNDAAVSNNMVVGADAIPGRTFGTQDTLVLDAPSVGIYFDDSSSVGAFPSRDWRLTANDTLPGGAEYLAIDDVSAGTRPFFVGGNAPNDSLIVEAGTGNVGVGTGEPITSLDVRGDLLVNGVASLDQINEGLANAALTGQDIYQSFQAGQSGALSLIEIRTGETTVSEGGNLTIYAGEGTGGTVLAAQTFSLQAGVNAWMSIPIDIPPSITAGQQYTMRFQTTSNLRVDASNGNRYPDGTFNGDATNFDIFFRTYVTTVPSAVGINTNAPATALDVNGTVTATAFAGDGSMLTNLPGGGWGLAGNAGTTPGTNFIGTTDNAGFQIHVNDGAPLGGLAFRVEPTINTDDLQFAPSVIGGASTNTIGATTSGAVIGGGQSNSISSIDPQRSPTIGGGSRNTISGGEFATISGGDNNTATSQGATVGGGLSNQAASVQATVAGGFQNSATGGESTIGGGSRNMASGARSTVGGGGDGDSNFVGNTASGNGSTVSGGQDNTASGANAAVGGGVSNSAGSDSSTIAGGTGNATTNDASSAIGGGSGNAAAGFASFIGAGSGNSISVLGNSAVIGGGQDNVAAASHATIAGGQGNRAETENYTTVGGGVGNTSSGLYATISGGNNNTASSEACTVGGGQSNTAVGANGTVSGGNDNLALGDASVVSGGMDNSANGLLSTVGGGGDFDGNFIGNMASGVCSVVVGGCDMAARGDYSAILGGSNNAALGEGSVVLGGVDNVAEGPGALAAGERALALHKGSFVWASGLDKADFASEREGEFAVQALGGAMFATAAPGEGKRAGSGIRLEPGSGAWTALCDRDSKENFAPVDSREVLERVAAMPIAIWNWKAQSAGVKHLGPTAQDFSAAFGLGSDDKGIATVDADGVALAAIQGLNAKLEAENAAQQSEIERLRAENSAQNERLARLEALVAKLTKE